MKQTAYGFHDALSPAGVPPLQVGGVWRKADATDIYAPGGGYAFIVLIQKPKL